MTELQITWSINPLKDIDYKNIINTIQMGQSLNDSLPQGSISQGTQHQLQGRFYVSPHPVYTNNPDFKLLQEKLTNKKYVLRVITINDQQERNKLQAMIFRRVANKNKYLPKLEHHIFEGHKGYCGTVTKCYLFFEIGQFTTLRQQLLKQPNHRVPFTEDQLLRGIQDLIYGLLWLRYLKQPHQNVNTLNIYSDPLISPVDNQNPSRYISPQKQQTIQNKQQKYDPYISDVFSIGMCILQTVKYGNMDRIYKINGKLNVGLLINDIERCGFERVRELLRRLLISQNGTEHREEYLQGFSKRFNSSVATSNQRGDKGERVVKIHELGGSKRNHKNIHQQQPQEVPERPPPQPTFITTHEVNNNLFMMGAPSRQKQQYMQEPQYDNFDKSQVVYRIKQRVQQPKSQHHIEYRQKIYQPEPVASYSVYQAANITSTQYRPQSVDKTPNYNSNLYRAPKLPLDPLIFNPNAYKPLKQPQIDLVSKKLDFVPKKQQIKSIIDKYSKDPLPSYQYSSSSYTSSSFLNHLNNSTMNYSNYSSKYKSDASGPKKIIGVQSTRKGEHSFPKRFSLERKYSQNQHFQKYLDMHSSIKKVNKHDSSQVSEKKQEESKVDIVKEINNTETKINAKQVYSEVKETTKPRQIKQQEKQSGRNEKSSQNQEKPKEIKQIVENFKQPQQQESIKEQQKQVNLTPKHQKKLLKAQQDQISDVKVVNSMQKNMNSQSNNILQGQNLQESLLLQVQQQQNDSIAELEESLRLSQPSLKQPQPFLKKKNISTPEVPSNKKKSLQNIQSSGSSNGFSQIIGENIKDLQKNISLLIEESIQDISQPAASTFKKKDLCLEVYKSQEKIEDPSPKDGQLFQGFSQEQKKQIEEDKMEESLINGLDVQFCTDVQKTEPESIEKDENLAENRPTSPTTPHRPYNPPLQARYNRTIPEQDEESNQDRAGKQQLGQYKQEQYQNGGRYCGFVHEGQRNGQGTFYYKDGGYYTGLWKNNAMNGYGKLYYGDGSLAYEGQWYKDQFHGRGKVYNDSASELDGLFNYKTFEGYEYYWKLYDGDLAHDIKQGIGKLVFSNGEYFTGMFHGDIPHGQGNFHTREKVIHGLWANGQLLRQL